MTTVKILLLSTAAVVGIGGTSVALTKDQWWPKENNNPEEHSSGEENRDVPAVPPSCPSEAQECSNGQVGKPSLTVSSGDNA